MFNYKVRTYRKGKSFFMNRLKDIIKFWKSTADEHMAAFAAQSAFFMFLSIFPIINIVIALPKLLPLTQDQIIDIINYVLPAKFEDYIGGLVIEMYNYNSAGSITIISVIIAVWSAAKGLTAIKYGLNEIYRSRENRNYLIVRGIGAAYTVILVVMIICLIPVNVFGTQIATYIFEFFPNLTDVTMLIYSLRGTVTFILLLGMFELMYTIIPNKKLRFKYQVPGAFFAALLWVIITRLFSLYIDLYAAKSFMYGSLTTVIMLMFWMYFVIYSLFIGAQVNEYLQFCRDREEKYELSKYESGVSDVWDDDDVDDKKSKKKKKKKKIEESDQAEEVEESDDEEIDESGDDAQTEQLIETEEKDKTGVKKTLLEGE